jgi:molecular chaperone DnaJ
LVGKRDYYEVLGLQRDAAPEQVKQAYRRLARQYHPDVNRDDHHAEERFKEIGEAYEVLSDAEKRRRYDAYGHEGLNGRAGGFGADVGFGDLLEMVFGGRPGRTSTGAAGEDGADLRVDLEISLAEAASGVSRKLTVTRLRSCGSCHGTGAKPGTPVDTCPTCRGLGQVRHTQTTFLGSFSSVAPCPRCRGIGKVVQDPCVECQGEGRSRQRDELTVEIPAGADTGTRLRLVGQGEAGTMGGRTGDLYVVVQVAAHERFERRGTELVCEQPLSFAQSALGATLEVPTLTGTAVLRVPPGTQTGTVLRIRDQGMPDVRGRGKGDLHVVVRVQTPTNLNEKQKRLLEELAALNGESVGAPPPEKGFLNKMQEKLGG